VFNQGRELSTLMAKASLIRSKCNCYSCITISPDFGKSPFLIQTDPFDIWVKKYDKKGISLAYDLIISGVEFHTMFNQGICKSSSVY
jgi:hypothetical protein